MINPDSLWVRADVEETYIDRVRVGDSLTIRLPSGDTRRGRVFYRAVDADFATQRDVWSLKLVTIKTLRDPAPRRQPGPPACGRDDRVRVVARACGHLTPPIGRCMPIVDVRQLTKSFGTFTAVDAISFTVDSGEILGLLGPNGAGKSTLLRMLTTLIEPTSGTALIDGADIIRQPDDVRRAMGVIPQAMTSDLELSARENLTIFAKLYGVPRANAGAG